MDASRVYYVVAGIATFIALLIFFPNIAALLIFVALVIGVILAFTCVHQINEPFRPVIFRNGQMYRLAPPGLVFLIPLIDTFEHVGETDEHINGGKSYINFKPITFVCKIYQIMTNDDDTIDMEVELEWQLRQSIDHIDDALRQTLLESSEQRQRHIEHVLSVVVRHLVMAYSSTQIKRADIRDRVLEDLFTSANELIFIRGLVINTLYWPRLAINDEIWRARREIKITHERVEGLIADVQTVQKLMPGLPAEEFLAYQAWIELLRKGISIPQMPGQITPPTQGKIQSAAQPPNP